MKRGISVKLKKQFSYIVDALHRSGIVNYDEKVITPSCVLISSDDGFFIYHFKEALEKDGNEVNIVDTDIYRRNYIVKLLELNGYVEVLEEDPIPTHGVMCDYLPWQLAPDYKLNKKYTFRTGNKE